MNYSITALAPVTSFDWKSEDAGGAMFLLRYKAAHAPDTGALSKNGASYRLREYNLFHRRATFAIRGYTRSISGSWG
jgi:hypothetical protein